MFDGKSRPRPAGTAPQQSRGSLLAEAATARAARSLNALLTSAAVRIQAFIRAVHVRSRLRTRLAAECDRKLSDVARARVLAGGGPLVVPLRLLLPMLRSYAWINASGSADVIRGRLDAMMGLLEASLASASAEGNVAALASSQRAQYAAVVSTVLRAIAAVLLRLHGPGSFLPGAAVGPPWERAARVASALLSPQGPVGPSGADALAAASVGARAFFTSAPAREAFGALQLCLLRACASGQPAEALDAVHDCGPARVLLAAAAAAVRTLSEGASFSPSRAAILALVLPLPLVASRLPPSLPTSCSPAAWEALLGEAANAVTGAPPTITFAPLASLRAAFTFANLVELTTSAAGPGASSPALVAALAALLRASPHAAFALWGASDARVNLVSAHQAAGSPAVALSGAADTEAARDAALEFGDTAEAVAAAADRNADLAFLLARRKAAACLAGSLAGGEGGAEAPLTAVPALTTQAQLERLLRPPHTANLGSGAPVVPFSGSSGGVSLSSFGLAAAGMTVPVSMMAQLDAAAAQRSAAQATASRASAPTRANLGVSPAPKRARKRGRTEELTTSVVKEHGAALLAVRPVQGQLALAYSPLALASLLGHAQKGGVAAVESLALLQSLQEKLRLRTLLRFSPRLSSAAASGASGFDGAAVAVDEAPGTGMALVVHVDCAVADFTRPEGTGEGGEESGGTTSAALLANLLLPVPEVSGAGPRAHVSLLHTMWASLSADPDLRRFTTGSATDALASCPALGSALTLLCEALAYAGAAVDDASWCDRGCPLPLSDTLAVLSFLKALLYRLAWADSSASDTRLTARPYAVLALLSPTLSAFNGLYDRHVRRPGWLAGAREGPGGASYGRWGSSDSVSGGAVGAGDALFLWPTLPSADLSVNAVLGIDDIALADEGGAGTGTGVGDDAMGGVAGVAALERAAAEAGLGRTERASVRSDRALTVLTSCPQVVSFPTRVALFTGLRQADKEARTDAAGWAAFQLAPGQPHRIQFSVRRDALLADSFAGFKAIAALDSTGARFKERLQVEFINAEGMPEAGIDGGGLMKEFLDGLVQKAFKPAGSGGLFVATGQHEVYPNPDWRAVGLSPDGRAGEWVPPGSTAPSPRPDALYEFAGRLLGKALYEGILVEPRFTPFLLRRLLGRGVVADDLAGYDMELYRNLASLSALARASRAGGGPDPLLSMGLTFATVEYVGGRPVDVPLARNGESLAVTRDSIDTYIARLARHRLHSSISAQVRAFLRGFRQVVPLPWMRMFGAGELSVLLGGRASAGFDVADLRANCGYGYGYHEGHPTILSLWRVLESLSPADQSSFLAFVTSVPRPPLLGFSTLHPRFGIACIPEVDRLPVAATCANLLKLPAYASDAVLREKLLYAIHSGAGFELT